MDFTAPIAYLAKLLNISLDEKTDLNLTSAQRARTYAWLKTNNYFFNKDVLSESFTLETLLIKNEEAEYFKENHKNENLQIMSPSKNGFTELVGIDIQSISELFPDGTPFDLKSDKELIAIFTLKELSYAQSRVNQAETLAGIFAAKEAILKTLDGSSNLLDIEIITNNAGRPIFPGYSISISHSADFAIAIAVAKS